MPSPSTHVCPREGCGAAVQLATATGASHGEPIWTCDAGHHGPSIVGYDGTGLG